MIIYEIKDKYLFKEFIFKSLHLYLMYFQNAKKTTFKSIDKLKLLRYNTSVTIQVFREKIRKFTHFKSS